MTTPTNALWPFLWAAHLTQNLMLTTQAGHHRVGKCNQEEASSCTNPAEENPGAEGEGREGQGQLRFHLLCPPSLLTAPSPPPPAPCPPPVGQQMKAKGSQQFDDERGEDVCQEHRLGQEDRVRPQTFPGQTSEPSGQGDLRQALNSDLGSSPSSAAP